MPNVIEKRGYKYTEEFGYIPEDWEVRSFDETFSFLQTNSVTRAELSDEGVVKNVHYGDILVNYPSILKYSDIKTYLNNNKLNNLKYAKNGDIIIADTAEDETVGKAVELQDLESNQKVVSGMHTMFCRPKDEKEFSSGFLGYFINSNTYHNQLLPLITGIKVSSVSKTGIKTTKIIKPDTKEQEKIAEVLGDIDNLIDKTQQLIDKKKDLKIATMQKLLTPKEDWEEKEFEQVFVKIPSKNYQINTLEYQQEGKYPVIDQGQSKICGYSDNKNKLYKNPNGIIIFGDHTRIIKYVDFDFVIGADGTQILNVKSENNIKFVYFMLCQKEIPNTGYNRHFKFLLDFKYYLPKRTAQDEIATILSDMDSEIEALEKELNKYKDLKTGMMQQLLTGKIRLVSNEVKSDNKVVDINSVKPTRSANDEFKDAILISMLAYKFGSEKYPLGAFRRQKLSYLFKRHNNIAIDEYMKKAMGPYNPKMKYQGAEGIALRNKYVKEVNNRGLIATNSISKAEEYYNRYYQQESLDWLDTNFHYESNNNLEVLTTVDYAIVDLRSQNKNITLENIKTYIASDEEWKPKLDKDFFTDEAITKAMKTSKTLLNSY